MPSGGNVTIGDRDAGVTIRALRSDPDLFGVLITGQANVVVENVSTIDCAHVFATAARGSGAAAVLLEGEGRNGCRNIIVRGGGASFRSAVTDPWHAACTLQFTDGFVVEDCRYRNVAHGVQWWGGDAAPTADGAWGRERKCRNGRVERVAVDRPTGCSVWGSMGEAIRVIDCRGSDAGDVGFDAEGSVDVEFLRCTQRNAKRGCFSTFFFNRSIVFRDCTGIQQFSAQPLFRIYSEVPGGNHDVSILGGRFECIDREPGLIDDAYGDVSAVTVRAATLVNVAIAFHHRPHAQVIIEDNSFTFPGGALATFDAIRVGLPAGIPAMAPLLRIKNNRITSRMPAPAYSIGVRILRLPGQAPSSVKVLQNRVTGFTRPMDVP